MLKKPNIPTIDSNRLIGNWKITHFQKGKHKKIFTSGFYYSIYKDSLNQNEFIRGNWQQYDTTQCSDVLMHKEKWHPRPLKEYDIEIQDDNNIRLLFTFKRKTEMIFLERMK